MNDVSNSVHFANCFFFTCKETPYYLRSYDLPLTSNSSGNIALLPKT